MAEAAAEAERSEANDAEGEDPEQRAREAARVTKVVQRQRELQAGLRAAAASLGPRHEEAPVQLPGPLPPWADELREDLYLPVPSLLAERGQLMPARRTVMVQLSFGIMSLSLEPDDTKSTMPVFFPLRERDMSKNRVAFSLLVLMSLNLTGV